MKIKLLLGVCCLFLFFCDCQKKKEIMNHDLLVESITDEDPQSIFSPYSGIILFCKTGDKEQIGYLTVSQMQSNFNNNNSFYIMGYRQFVKAVITQEITLGDGNIENQFILNGKIMSEYNKNSFSKFLSNYTRSINDNEYSVATGLSPDETMTIIYCLFQNNYYTSFDDYIGLYYSRKIDFFIKKKAINDSIQIL